ncbi:MAG TPA: hypothetical protein VJ650_16435 [Gemmatimonadaceae bacterium]|nr:hypothetical protein [Gemmatimonadaceae bacterium]
MSESSRVKDRVLRGVVVLALALGLTLLSTVVSSTRLEVQDWDCPPAPASCARPVLVLGFPLPYISDYHGISVVGSASLSGAVLGEDHFHLTAFLANVVLYFVAGLLVATTVQSRRRVSRAPDSPGVNTRAS